MNDKARLFVFYKGVRRTGGYAQRLLAVTAGRGKTGFSRYIPVTDTRLTVVGLHTGRPATLATAA